jgi:hypothetical protein
MGEWGMGDEHRQLRSDMAKVKARRALPPQCAVTPI